MRIGIRLLALTLTAAATVLPHRKHHSNPGPAAPPTFIPANSPSIWYTGRNRINADGSRTHDWEGSQVHINVEGASYVRATINASAGILGRFICEVDGWEVSSFFVGGGNAAVAGNDFLCADDLYQTRHIRLIQILEPAFSGASPMGAFTFLGFTTDGTPAPPTPRTRKIELVGDSISAGYGARGKAGMPYGCPVDDLTSGNYYTYNWALAEAFNADIHVIAWSGKGMYENCCDSGEKMPSYYLQTLGGTPYATDWDFSRFVPDMMLINLGRVLGLL